MSDDAPRVAGEGDIRELIALLAGLTDTVQRLSPGPERTAAIMQIEGFRRRLDTYLAARRFIAGFTKLT